MPEQVSAATPHHVVIVGAGFGGLTAARHLRRAPVDVTLIDQTNHHLFQPLLYQVATGVLSIGDIAAPTRDILRRSANTTVLLGQVVDIDLDARLVRIDTAGAPSQLTYDTLIVATGAGQSYFGEDQFAPYAPGVKTLDDALEIRQRIFSAFEMAELDSEFPRRRSWLTFVVVGAGPTGVEMAGQIAELSRRALKQNFRNFDPASARIVLVEAGDRILASFPEPLQRRAHRDLTHVGVEVRLSARVTGVDVEGVDIAGGDGTPDRIEARTKVWAAGVSASPLGAILAAGSGAGTDRTGRVAVLPDCTLPNHPEVFVIGDLMTLDGLPGVAEVAIQSGLHAASSVRRRLGGTSDTRSFKYRDLGTMATIARFRAVVTVGKLRVTGPLGWLMWLTIHLTFMNGFHNRLAAVMNWGFAFVGRNRRQRAFTARQALTRATSAEPRDTSDR